MANSNDSIVSQDEAVKANILVHTTLSDRYNQSPHFRPENREKVKSVIKELRAQLKTSGSEKRLLDMGCGTGFILSLAHPYFNELHGIDVTEAMIKQVDLSPGNIKTHISQAEKTPFPNEHFDMVTAYTFIDHLADIRPFMAEVFRVLKPGGVFYSDLNPNRAYWDYLFKLDEGTGVDIGAKENYSAIVKREIDNVVHNDALLSKETGIPEKVIAAAESTKQYRRGFSRNEMTELAKSIGFKSWEYKLDWFMGQGPVMHSVSFEAAATIERHLRDIAPASDHLFKYLRFVLTK